MKMSDRPMVSIVVAAYNAEKYIEENIESLLNQTYSDFELIYVNDGSKDNTFEILQEYQKQDERVILLSQENQGAGAARNLGMSHALGKYLMVLDADDYFDIRMLEVIIPLAEERKTDILIFDSWELNHQTGVCTPESGAVVEGEIPEQEVFSAMDIIDGIFRISRQYVWNKLYRKEFIDENKIEFQTIRITDDRYFEMLSIMYAKRISVCRERLVYYRKNHLTNQMANTSQLSSTYYQADQFIFAEMKKRGLYDLFEKSLLEKSLNAFIYSLYANKEFKDFKKAFYDIKNVYLPTLGFYEIEKKHFKSDEQYRVVQNIKNMSLDEFLFLGASPVTDFGLKYFPSASMIACPGRIVLYGAGVVGKNYYSFLLASTIHHVVAWVDLKYSIYQEQSMPVQPPAIIQGLDYDYVYIAVKEERIKDEISYALTDFGVKKEKIIWHQPEIIL